MSKINAFISALSNIEGLFPYFSHFCLFPQIRCRAQPPGVQKQTC